MRIRTTLILLAIAAFAGCADSGGVSIITDLVPETPDEGGELTPLADVVETAGTDERPDVAIPDGAVCVPGHTQCVGTNFMTCNGEGSDWTSVRCLGAPAERGARSRRGACVPTGIRRYHWAAPAGTSSGSTWAASVHTMRVRPERPVARPTLE